MKTLKEMLEERKALLAKADAILNKARDEKDRELTADEIAEYDKIVAGVEALDVKIDREKDRLNREQRQNELEGFANSSAGRPPKPDLGIQTGGLSSQDHKDLNKFSFVKFARDAMDGNFTGIEKEMAQQAVIDARNAGRQVEGLGIPQMVLANSGRRHTNEMSVTGDSGEHGGALVPTELRPMIDILREALQVRAMGAQLVGGLVGNVDFPRGNDTDDPEEKTETGESDELSPEIDTVSLSPKRLPVHGVVTRQLLLQTSEDVERWFREFLAFRIASRMDKGALVGSGTGAQPTGLYNVTGVPVLPIDTNGGAPTREHIVRLEGMIDSANANFGNVGYLTTPGVRTKLKLTKLDDGSGQFVWSAREELNGYVARVSTNSPSNLTKGTGEDLHGIAFGNWAGMLLGQWGGLDLLVNPYSLDTAGKIRINLWTFYDVAVERPEMFALVKDADIS